MAFFQRLLQLRFGPHKFSKEEPFGIAGLDFLQARCCSCCPTNSVEALKEEFAFLLTSLKFCLYFVLVLWQVMMMFFPLVLMFLLPKLINTQDPETQRVCRMQWLLLAIVDIVYILYVFLKMSYGVAVLRVGRDWTKIM